MLALCSLALFAAASCSDKKDIPAAQTEAVAVKTEKIMVQDYAKPVQSAGIITSDKEARLSFKVTGIISKLYVNEGDMVNKGQILATLDQTEISAQLQQAKNDYEKAVRNHNRMGNLHKDNAATQEEYENSATSLNSAKQLYDIARFNKQYATIYANQQGSVIKKEMNEGEIANAGAAVYTINASGSEDWVIKIGLPDKEWIKLKKGDRATITADAYRDKKFDAVVSEIGLGADPQTGTFLVKLKIKPVGYKFASGLAAKVAIYPSHKERLSFIPASALVEANGNSAIVYSLNQDGKTIKKHSVQIAFTENNRVAVRSGLEGATIIITDGASYLSEGSNIKL
jgi:RND family efflux transporter MFP subunit